MNFILAMTLENQHNPDWETNKTTQDLVLLAAYILKCRWIVLFLFLVISGSSIYYYHAHTYYQSEISFLVNSNNVTEVLWDRSNDGPIDVYNDDRGFQRVNQIVYSTQMIDYLITQFDLYTHYRISKETPDSYLLVANKLKKSLAVSESKTKIITLHVSDPLDYNVAANIANTIGKKINDINRQITVENLSRKTEMLESLSRDLRSNSSKEFSDLDSLLQNMQRFLTNSIHDDSYRQLLSMNIENLRNKSEDYFKDLFESYKYRLYSMYSLQEKNLPTISVLEKGLPNRLSKTQYDKFMYPLITFFSILTTFVLFYFFMKIISLLRYVLRRGSEMKTS